MTDLQDQTPAQPASQGWPTPQEATTPDPAVAETFGELPATETDPQAFIDDQAVEGEPVETDLAAEIAQMEHERNLQRTQAMINIGIGLTMVQCGIQRMDFSHQSLAAFSSKFDVVSIPSPDGGYSMIVLTRDSDTYRDYLNAGIDAEQYFASPRALQKGN